MENANFDERESVEASRYYLHLRGNTAGYKYRLALVDRLDVARKSTESGIEIVFHLVEAFFDAAKTILPNEEIDYDADEMRRSLMPVLKKTNLKNMLILFRKATDQDLENYIEYWKTRDGQRVVALMNAALEAGARQGSAVAMEMVAAKRHTVP